MPNHSVAAWPTAAAASRWIVHAAVDSDVLLVDQPPSSGAAELSSACLLSARTGRRLRNVHHFADGRLAFEPEAGPGKYELYYGCVAEAEGAQPDARFAAALAKAALPEAHVLWEESRSLLGPQWPEPIESFDGRHFSYGNMRARIHVSQRAALRVHGAVRCLVQWRRPRGSQVATQLYLFHAAHPNERLHNVLLVTNQTEEAWVVFQPAHGAGEYLLYYLPHTTRWATYDGRDERNATSYEALLPTHDARWFDAYVGSDIARRAQARADAASQLLSHLRAAVHFDNQARTHADRFDAMERPATASEEAFALQRAGLGRGVDGRLRAKPYVLFAEQRTRPLKSSCALPQRWASKSWWARRGGAGASGDGPATLRSTARPGEFFVWQVGVWAAADDDVNVLSCSMAAARYSPPSRREPPPLRCLSLNGTSAHGEPLRLAPWRVRAGCVRALWFGVALPKDVAPGDVLDVELELRLQLARAPSGSRESGRVKLRLEIAGVPLDDQGDAQRWRLSRLRWLDSTLGHGAVPPAPFGRVRASRVKGHIVLRATMGSMVVGASGLPSQLLAGRRTRASVAAAATELLESPMRMIVRRRGDSNAPGVSKPVRWRRPTTAAGTTAAVEAVAVRATTDERIEWGCARLSEDGSLRMAVAGTWWFDAQAQLSVTLTAVGGKDVEVEDVSLIMPVRTEAATYLMGFGEAARRLEDLTPLQWRWGERLGNYQCWLGDVGAGVRLRLTGATEAFESPQHLLSAADLERTAWHNGGLGGAAVSRGGVVRAHSGVRTLRAGESIAFTFELLLTPCKPLDTTAHWRQRHYQVGYPDTALVEPVTVAAHGATVLNLHQGVDGMLNPYINYPFDPKATARLADYAGRAHAAGLKLKMYYTIRNGTGVQTSACGAQAPGGLLAPCLAIPSSCPPPSPPTRHTQAPIPHPHTRMPAHPHTRMQASCRTMPMSCGCFGRSATRCSRRAAAEAPRGTTSTSARATARAGRTRSLTAALTRHFATTACRAGPTTMSRGCDGCCAHPRPSTASTTTASPLAPTRCAASAA